MNDKTQILVSVNDQVLKITDAPTVASGGLNEVEVVFSFCDKWAGFVKTAIFYRDIEDPYYAVLDGNDTCTVPWEVCYEEGTFFFGVFGEKGITRRTAVMTRYKVKGGAITPDMKPSDPTPDVYDQIMAMLAEIRDSQKTFIEDAETAVENVNTATQNAQTATENANTATENANTATVDANTATANANNAASNARIATEKTNTARETIQQTASEVLSSLSGAVFATPIECSATGEVVVVKDASNQLLRGLTLYGKTTQNGTPTPETPVELVSLGPMGETTMTVNSANELVIAMRQIGSLNIDKYFGDYVGRVSYEMDYRIELNGCLDVDPNVFVVRGVDASGADVSVLNPKVYISNTGITFGVYDGGGEYPISTVCEEGKTYRVKAVLDPETDTYDLYVDGQKVIAGRSLRCHAAVFNGIRLTVHRSVGRTTPKIYCDNISVAGQYAPVFAEGFSSEQDGVLKLTSGTLAFGIGEAYDGKVAVEYKTKVVAESNNFDPCILVRGDAGTFAKIIFKNGAVGLGNGLSTRGTYTDDTWYTVKIVADPATQLFEVYLDGTRITEDRSYNNPATNINALYFQVGSGTGTAYFDDLTVAQVEAEPQTVFFTEEFPDKTLVGWIGGMTAVKEGSINAVVCGKNLFTADINNPVDITYTNIDGAAQTKKGFEISLPVGKYTARVPSAKQVSEVYLYGRVVDSGYHTKQEVNLLANQGIFTITFDITHGDKLILYHGANTVSSASVTDLFTNYPVQIEAGSVATTYEAPNYGHLTASAPNGLPGIPVDSGGNYTDEAGQHWICDEIDFARGVRIQRVRTLILTGTEGFAKASMFYYFALEGSYAAPTATYVLTKSTHFVGIRTSWNQMTNNSVMALGGQFGIRCDDYATLNDFNAFLAEQYANGTPVTVYYALATPIETALSAEELEHYAALHSDKPNTTAFNDAGAGMKLSYVADTKTYIDQKIAALSAALLNN